MDISGSSSAPEVVDCYLGWDGGQSGELQSDHLYCLDGQPDSEGPVNYDVYAAFNRTIGAAWRNGSGVTKVTVILLP